MKRKRSAAACLLIVLGAVLTAAGLWPTLRADDILQYVLIAPGEEGAIEQLLDKKDEALEEMADVLAASCVSAYGSGAYVSAPDAGAGAQAALYAGGEGFFEVYPRYLLSGRLPSETELRTGASKAALDEELAFKLYPTVDPVGKTIDVNGVEMEIVGVVRHSRRVGEEEEFGVYAPLGAVQEFGFETVSLSAIPLAGSGAHILFEDTVAGTWQGGGYFYRLEKEAMRAQLPALYTAVLFALVGLAALIRRVNALAASFGRKIRNRLEREYIGKIWPLAAAGVLGLILLYALLGGAIWLVARQAVQPLYMFPEWVPENLVQWSSICDVFWNLATSAMQPVNAASLAVREMQFWAGVVRWGVLLVLSGALMRSLRREG